MWCLTLATNAVVTWTPSTTAWPSPRSGAPGGTSMTPCWRHIWPTHHENVHFYGTHSVDVDGELAKLDSDGYRPLRADAATEQAR